MSSSLHFRDDDTLDDEAATWLCEREAGFAPARARAFDAWCNASPRHAAAIRRVEQALALLDEMPAVRGALQERVGAEQASRPTLPPMAPPRPSIDRLDSDRTEPSASPTESARRAIRFPSAVRWTLAAAAALTIAALAWWQLDPGVPGNTERYVTAAAVQQRLGLQDGSTIDLNGGSDLRVEFTAQRRAIKLETGEAHFKVAHDPARPFIVTAGDVSVRAVGTAFNVRRLDDGSVDVLVVEGRVEVTRHALASVMDVRPVAAGERTRIARTMDPALANDKIEKVDATTVRTALAWQDQITRFSDVPLRELVAQFNRHNATQLALADAATGDRKIGGVIALEQVEAFVRLLEDDGDLVADRSEPGRIILRRAR